MKCGLLLLVSPMVLRQPIDFLAMVESRLGVLSLVE
jgi:hypothetical protein